MIYCEIHEQRPLLIWNCFLIEYREVPILFMTSEPLLKHLDILVIDADDSRLLDCDVQGEGLVIVVEMDCPDETNRIRIGKILI